MSVLSYSCGIIQVTAIVACGGNSEMNRLAVSPAHPMRSLLTDAEISSVGHAHALGCSLGRGSQVGGEREAGDLPEPLQRAHQVLRAVELDRAVVASTLDPNVEQMRDRRAAPAVPRVEVVVRKSPRRVERLGSKNAVNQGSRGRRSGESEPSHFTAAAHGHLDEGATGRLTGLDDLGIVGISTAHIGPIELTCGPSCHAPTVEPGLNESYDGDEFAWRRSRDTGP